MKNLEWMQACSHSCREFTCKASLVMPVCKAMPLRTRSKQSATNQEMFILRTILYITSNMNLTVVKYNHTKIYLIWIGRLEIDLLISSFERHRLSCGSKIENYSSPLWYSTLATRPHFVIVVMATRPWAGNTVPSRTHYVISHCNYQLV